MATRTPSQKRRITGAVLFGVVGGMVGLSFASVPLYRLFCQATGYGGTPRTEGVTASTRVSDRMVTVRFDANVNSALPWRFEPAQREVRVRLGEETLAHFTATNVSDRPITGTATFNVTPYFTASYFNKIECFCFTEQRLEPHQEVSMPVLFYVDPAMLNDRDARDASAVTLSYTFYQAGKENEDRDRPVADAGTSARTGG